LLAPPFSFLHGRNTMSAGLPSARYHVVGIGRNGTRDVRSENLTWATVEPVQVAMLASGLYRRVVIELPPAKGRGNPKTDLRQFRAPGRKCGRA